MINFFKGYFTTKFSNDHFKNLRLITKSLLTLMPLHNKYLVVKSSFIQ